MRRSRHRESRLSQTLRVYVGRLVLWLTSRGGFAGLPLPRPQHSVGQSGLPHRPDRRRHSLAVLCAALRRPESSHG